MRVPHNADRAKVITACATLARTSWHVDDEEMAEVMRQHCCVARDAAEPMTHVLDPLIGYLDQKPTEGCACKICEGCREGLRILRAEREGRREDDAAKWLDGYEQVVAERNKLQDEVDELRGDNAARQALDKIAKLCGCPHWEYPGQVVRDVGHLRAEGRRQERERVVQWLNKRSEEAPPSPPYGGGPEEYMVLDGVAACIEDGDHWRGGEG